MVQVAGVNIEAEERGTGTGADATRPARSMPPETSCFSIPAIRELVRLPLQSPRAPVLVA